MEISALGYSHIVVVGLASSLKKVFTKAKPSSICEGRKIKYETSQQQFRALMAKVLETCWVSQGDEVINEMKVVCDVVSLRKNRINTNDKLF